MEQETKAEPRFTEKYGEERDHAGRIKQAMNTFGQTSQRGADPKSEKPPVTKTTTLVTADSAKNRCGDEGAEKRFRHDDSPEQERAAGAEINQPSQKSAPVINQALANKNFALLKSDPHHPSLHFKKIGTNKQLWSVRVGAHYRALGREKPVGILWFWIGKHSIYDKLLS